MPFRKLAVAGMLAVGLALPGNAEAPRPPAELPPPDYAGTEYVDSAGCVFLRAGVGESVAWVARISPDRRQICGLAPTVAPVRVAAKARSAPARPAAARAHRSVREVAETCPAAAPYPRRVATAGGKGKLICLSADIDTEAFPLPQGYRRAWGDDRLNPLRGLGTVEGQAMQDRVWTRKVPARLEVPPMRPSSSTAVAAAETTAPSAAGVTARLVQVGSFAMPANAARAQARLAAMDLPVVVGQGAVGGRRVTFVYAGPFADPGTADAALRTIRAAGFGDAFLRKAQRS